MKPLCNRITSWASKERGIALIMFMLTLPVLLGLTSLAIDTANLFMARQAVNKVARVSAASGLNIRGLRGWASLVTDDDDGDGKARKTGGKDPDTDISSVARGLVADTMVDVARYHLGKYFPRDSASVAQYFDVWSGTDWQNLSGAETSFKDTLKRSLKLKGIGTDPEQIRVRYRYRVRTLFVCSFARLLGMSLPGIDCANGQNRSYVQSDDVASGKLSPANIYVLLDTSGSMKEEAVTGDPKTKKQYLDEAMAQFIDYFNPYKDKISLIPFGYGVKTGGTALGNFTAFSSNHLNIKSTVIGLPTMGMTNHCDALIAAIQAIPNNSTQPNFVVLFTDGAPNTYRLQFCRGTAATPNCAVEPVPLNTARGAAAANLGWYGWLVRWGKREVAKPLGTAIDKDPVLGMPMFKDGSDLPVGPVTVDQNLNFRKGDTGNGALTNDSPKWWLQFDGAEPNNYKWFGPSYLVYSDWGGFGDQSSLIDRIAPANLASVKTCGSPGRIGNNYDINEQYNHSRYFASRVVDSTWTIDRAIAGTTQRNLVGLNVPFPTGNPVVAWLKDSSLGAADTALHPLPAAAPGCLTSLNSVVPQTGGAAQILVGNSFLSNTAPATSVPQVGEIVKTAELPYYCAVRAADYLRSQKNAIVFVVGLGTAAGTVYGATCNDPMQNPLDSSSRKDYFLRRLAFAPESLDSPEKFIGGGTSVWAANSDFRYQTTTFAGCTNHPLNPAAGAVQVNIGYSEDAFTVTAGTTAGTTAGRQPAGHNFTPANLGAYYGSNRASDLNALFAKIAKQILSRLSS